MVDLPSRVKLTGVGGFDPLGVVVNTLWKSAKMGLRSVLDNLQLNNSLTRSNFRYFTFPR